MKNLLTINDLSFDNIKDIFKIAEKMKLEYQQGEFHQPLKDKTLGMIFERRSTRTRVSFEVGMFHLGGYAVYLNPNDLHLENIDNLIDTVSVLSRYIDGIMIRTNNHEDVKRLTEICSLPIINGQTNLYHPCQILSDIFTIHEYQNTFEGIKLAYIGDGNNIANSLLLGCSKVGIDVSVATPLGFECDNEAIKIAQAEAEKNNSNVTITTEVSEAVRNADVVYTSPWFVDKSTNRDEKLRALKEYQVNGYVLSTAKEDCLFMHSLPAFRGMEATSNIIDGAQSVILEQCENRLHIQKAILQLLMS